jgi:glycosyltransferase involved in cell wall biosynthesis
MKIILLTRSLAIGGAERQLAALAGGLKENDHDVTVLSFYPEGAFAEGLRERGVRLETLDKRGRWDWLGFAVRLIRFVRRNRPDVLHTYLPVPNIVAAVCRPFFTPLRLVWGVRAADVDLSKYDRLTRMSYHVERAFARLADLIIVNSAAGLHHSAAQGFPLEKMLVIPNGVDVHYFQPDEAARRRQRQEWGIADEERLIGMVARLDPMKDHQTFLQAAALVARQREDVRFVCVGDGPPQLLEMLQELARSLGIARRFLWLPATSDVRSVYNAFDVVCLSSYTEGFPNVLGEAMACGTPCVATDAGDSRLIIGPAGIVVLPRAPAELAAGLLRMLETLSSYREVARARIIENFSVKTLIHKTELALAAGVPPR